MERTYELVVLLHPDLEIDVEAPIKKIENIVKANGGSVVKHDNWGKKRLAYRVNKQDFAVYVYFEVKVDPSKVRDIENTLLITEEVLRHMLVSHDESAVAAPEKSDKPADDEKVEKTEDKEEESK
jgi:small subunit ribosomal protein S6